MVVWIPPQDLEDLAVSDADHASLGVDSQRGYFLDCLQSKFIQADMGKPVAILYQYAVVLLLRIHQHLFPGHSFP